MIVNVINPEAYNPFTRTQEELQMGFREDQESAREVFEEWNKDIDFPDFSLPPKQWVAQIPDKFKFKVPKGTKILFATYGEEDETEGDFKGTALEKDSSGLVGLNGDWSTLPEFELIVDDDETFVINVDLARYGDDIFTNDQVVWMVDKAGNLYQLGGEPAGCTKKDPDSINPSLFNLYDYVVKHQ